MLFKLKSRCTGGAGRGLFRYRFSPFPATIFGALVFLMIALQCVEPMCGLGHEVNKNNLEVAALAASPLAFGFETKLTDTHRLAKRMDLESCLGQFDVHKNTIIRTGESQAIGGKYLQGLELDTIEECQRLCCESEGCDVYIFEDKNDGYCYLFDCGPPENFHCKFTRHANYTSAVLTPVSRRMAESTTQHPPPQPHISTTNISQQERELTSLKVKPDIRDKPDVAVSPAQAAGLLMASNTALVGMPQVSQPEVGFPVKAPNNTAICGRFQFACHSGECIAVYNACDGIPQCEDGSDEGPECSGAAAGSAVAGAKYNQEQINNNNIDVAIQKLQSQPAVQYQQQTQPQQQLAQLQQQQQQQAVVSPQLINNREDSAAWANRKMVADNQQNEVGNNADLNSRIFNHKGGLQVPTSGVATFPNANISPMYAATLQRSGIYMPQTAEMQPTYSAGGGVGGGGALNTQIMQQQGQINVPPSLNWQQQQPSFPATSGTQMQNSAYIMNPAVPNQIVQQQQLPGKPALVPLANDMVNMPPISVQQQQQQQLMSPSVEASAAVALPNVDAEGNSVKQQQTETADEYENSEEQSTQPPKKQRKHKKVKSKTSEAMPLPKPMDPIELALAEQKQHPAPPSPVHEQYKMIHENLAMEFRDHDGQSERPGGALLSLTLGVLVTAALAILVGCRMRTVGRRSRRMGGKTPYAHEADFLVNGMYL